jgi:diguanylate cyclase (GGDEF)-like protein
MLKPSLLAQLLGSLAAIQVIALALMFWQGAELIETTQDRLLRHRIKTDGLLLSQALAPDLAARDPIALRNTLEQLRHIPFLRYAAVANTDWERLAALGTPPALNQDPTGEFRFLHFDNDAALAIEQPIEASGKTWGILQLGFDKTWSRASVDDHQLRSLLIGLAAVLAGCAAVLIIAWRFERAQRRLVATLSTLREGDWNQVPNAHRMGAMQPLAVAVNELSAARQKAWQDMEHQLNSLQQQSESLSSLLYGIHAGVWYVDPDAGRFLYVSQGAERLLGCSLKDLSVADFCERYVHGSDRDWVRGFLTHPGAAYNVDFRVTGAAHNSFWLRMISTLEHRDEGPIIAGLLLNVTEEKRNELRMSYMADHDPLTGLINRRRFQERLEEQIAHNDRYNNSSALLFLDLDQFKYVNDSHGHCTGDEYLRQVAYHLRQELGKSDVIGRLGGDEFGIILPNADSDKASRISEKLLKRLNSKEFIHDNHGLAFRASIGIALFPQHGNTASALLTRADSAMYTAKGQGRNTYRTCEERLDAERMHEKVLWEERIRHALKHDRFQLYFQPIVDVHSGLIVHYESLLRMIGEQGEIIAPGAFIGVAERFGTIRDIDGWVVENAIRAQAASARIGKPVSLTINLSGRYFGNLGNSDEILEIIEKATRGFGATPNMIVFEVTETAAVENFSEACRFIQALKDKGYRFALDDFGSGYAGFDYLKNMPVNYIKIDGSFIRNLNHDPVDQILVRTIADMARKLNVRAVAEFVENRETLEVLRGMGVPLGQGYFFAKPQPRFHEYERLILPDRTEKKSKSGGGLALCS